MQFNRVERGALLIPQISVRFRTSKRRGIQLKEQIFRCSVGGYHVGFSLLKHEFESRHRNWRVIQLKEHFGFYSSVGSSVRLLIARSQVRALLGTWWREESAQGAEFDVVQAVITRDSQSRNLGSSPNIGIRKRSNSFGRIVKQYHVLHFSKK